MTSRRILGARHWVMFFFAVVLFAIGIYQVPGQTSVSGNQSDKWTEANSPYLTVGNVIVPAGDTLIMEQTMAGEVSSDITLRTDSVAGGALNFDGNDFVKIDNNVGLSFGPDGSFTLEAWIKTSMTGAGEIIRRDDNYGLGRLWEIRVYNGYAQIELRGAGGSLVMQTGNTFVADDKWHHIAGVRDASADVVRIYVDGKEDWEPVADAAGDFYISQPTYIGCLAGAYAFFHGLIDEVRIWSVARTPEEILGAMHFPVSGQEADLVSYWRFDEGNGQSTADSSRSGNHGTLGSGGNGPAWVASDAPLYQFEPTIARIVPNVGTNTKVQRATIAGWGFQTDAEVRLVRSGYQDIIGMETSVTVPKLIRTNFDLAGAQVGNWDVVVINPDGQRMVLSEGFTIQPNAALSFDGNDFVKIDRNVGLGFGPDDSFTLEAWVKTSMTGVGEIIRRDDNYGLARLWEIRVFNGYAQMELRGSGGALVVQTGNTFVADDMWHHIAGVRDASADVVRIYVDGKEDWEPVAYAAGDFYISQPTYIGCLAGSQAFFTGLIDEVRIWNVARTPEEILGAMHFPVSGQEDGLVGYWRLDEKDGGIAADFSPNGNNGKLGSASYPDDRDPAWIVSDAPLHRFEPTVARIVPNVGTNTKVQRATIAGWGFQTDAEVRLVRSGYQDIIGMETSVTVPKLIRTNFDLAGAQVGNWDVVIINPGGQRLVLSEGFTVQPNAALSFDGNDFVKIENNVGLGFGAGDSFTLEAWVKTSMTGIGEIIRRNHGYGLGRLWNIRVFNGYAQMELCDSNGRLVVQTGNTFVADDKWHHIAGVRDVSTDVLRIYVDGREDWEPEPDVTVGDFYISPPTYIGCLAGNDAFFNGLIDEVRIWNVARTDTEIASSMHFPLSGDEPGLVSYWPLDEGEGRITADLSQNDNYGQHGSTALPDANDPRWVVSGDPIWPRRPSVVSISPDSGVNAGTTRVTIVGWEFQAGAEAKLVKAGYQDIIGAGTEVVNSSIIVTNFDLAGRELGYWNVVITNQDGRVLTLTDGFLIAEGYTGLWVEVVGRKLARFNRMHTYTVSYGNSGNTEANGSVLFIAVTKGATVELPRPTNPAISIPGINWDEVPVLVETESELWYPSLIGRLAPGEVRQLKLGLQVHSPENTIRAWITPPLFSEGYSPSGHAFQKAIQGNSPGHLGLEKSMVAVSRQAGVSDDLLKDVEELENRYKNGVNEMRKSIGTVVLEHYAVEWGLTLFTVGAVALAITLGAPVLPSIAIGVAVLAIAHWSTANKLDKMAERTLAVLGVGSMDPNEKASPQGAGGLGFIPATRAFPYTIFFENLDSATAAAQEVIIIDTLDVDLDWSRFAFGDFQFCDTLITINGLGKNFNKSVHINDTTDVVINGSIEPASGAIRWHFRGTDTRTGELADFLPPNRLSPQGEGWVSFTATPKANLASGARIENRANIVFDVNPPMATNQVFNTIDAAPPTSHVETYSDSSDGPNFEVYWSGVDDSSGSGVMGYTVYAATDGGAYERWQTQTPDRSGVFTAEANHTYWFYSVARDSTGLLERMPERPDLTIWNAGYDFSCRGWHLAAISNHPAEDSLQALFPGALAALRWNPKTQSHDSVSTLDTTAGYWLAIPEAKRYCIAGKPLASYRKHLKPGWHLLGGVAQEIDFAAPNADPDGSVLAAYAWDPSSQEYQATTTLSPNHGYWVAVIEECDVGIGEEIPVTNVLAPDVKEAKRQAFIATYGATPPLPPLFPSGVEGPGKLPTSFELFQNYPNPFNPAANIKFALPKPAKTKIVIYNLMGQQVRVLIDTDQPAGYHTIQWDGTSDSGNKVATGLYFYRMKAGDYIKTRKMMLIR